MKRFLNWLAYLISPERASPRVTRYRAADSTRRPVRTVKTAHPSPTKPAEPEFVEFDASVGGKIDSAGPGKNVLRQPRLARQESAAQETLSIVDDTREPQSNDHDDGGIDPYNTGRFDRSKNWDKRFRKD